MGRPEKALDPDAGPVERFAAELRALRTSAGRPTYRVLAQRTPYSAAALSQAAAGEKLPSLAVTLAYARACGADTDEWEKRWHDAADDVAATSRADDRAEPPYRGLTRFRTEDSDVFFGREQLVDSLLALTRQHRCAAVLGPSGSGKSSLLRAGLIPRLRRTDPHGPRPRGPRLAAVRVLTPGEHPVRTHADKLTPAEGPGDTFLLVDQFEEVFTLCPDPAERAEFIRRLLAARREDSRLRVVLGVRADFYGHCLSHPELVAVLREATVPVGPMSPAELRRAVTKPAVARGLIVERALTARLVDEVANEPGGLPLLSHALLETWRRRSGRVLTLRAYEAAGGVRGAIAQTAEEVYASLSPDRAELARLLLLRLVTPGEGAQDTRRPVDRSELDFAPREEVAALLDRWVAARLLTLDDGTVDLAHEALITAWPRLHDWIDEDRQRLRVHRRLTEAADAWQQLGRDTGALYRGIRLELAAGLDRRSLSAAEKAFVDAGLAAQAAEEAAVRRRARRRSQAVALLTALLMVAGATALWAVRAQRTAREQRDIAVSREYAARSDALLTQRPEEAVLAALKGFERRPTLEARSSLISAYGMFRANRLTGHTKSSRAVTFSPDGRTVASAGDDHAVKLWDATTWRLLATLSGHTDTVTGVAFSPDGRILATSGADHSVKLWNAATQRVAATLTGHTDAVNAVAYSPDGDILATAGSDHTVRLWNPRTRRTTAVLTGHTDAVLAVAFSPDGRTLATAGSDHTVRLWNTRTRTTAATLTGHREAVQAVAFSPDGRTLASAGDDSTGRLWNVRTRRTAAILDGDGESLRGVAFSPDGRLVATTGMVGTVTLWNSDTHRRVGTMSDRSGTVNAVAFRPDGRMLTTAADGTVKVWNTATRRPLTTLGDTMSASAVAFSPDGHSLATSFADGTVSWWDLRRQRETATLTGHRNNVPDLAFSPDGRTLATVGVDTTVRLWSTATHQPIALLKGHRTPVLAVSFSPDGRTLATAAYDGTVRLWNPTERRTVAVLTGHTDAVFTLAFSPDGRTLATAGGDRTVRLWNTATGRTTATLTGHRADVQDLAFHPEGRLLATASTDHTTNLWDTTTHRITAALTDHSEAVSAVTFSRDGETLITGSRDRALRLWDVGTHRITAVLRGHTTGIHDLALSPDGRTLVSLSTEEAASRRLWNLDPGQITRHICRTSADHHWPELLPASPRPTACGDSAR